jgi:hypothetical protein
MKIAIIADILRNLEALRGLPENFDELWVLGDLVNYGRNRGEVVDFVQANASVVFRGNHDHAFGFDEDPQGSSQFREMAQAMQEYTNSVLSESQRQFLRNLPLLTDRELRGVKIPMCHAVPSEPLFTYCPPDLPRWKSGSTINRPASFSGRWLPRNVEARLVLNQFKSHFRRSSASASSRPRVGSRRALWTLFS